jgi:hypothetical protein
MRTPMIAITQSNSMSVTARWGPHMLPRILRPAA